MAELSESGRLKKELTLFHLFAIATGATLSSGFFLLPGLAAAQAGPATVLCYLIAAVFLVPGVFSMAELSTAMPRAGGIYYYLDRSMGPVMGTIGGIGTWVALSFKGAFALIGVGAYLSLLVPDIPMRPLAIFFAVLFGVLNLGGAKKSSRFQIVLVAVLLVLLVWFLGVGVPKVDTVHFEGFLDKGWTAIFGTTGMVFISYVGVTNIASLSEEVKNPERNLSLAMLLALFSAIAIYGIGTYVMVGVLPPEKLHGTLTPVADTAFILVGRWGLVVMTVAAVLSFFSVANAAILGASRYPLAMSRDHLIPGVFRTLSRQRTPNNAIYVTVGLIILCLIFFDPTKIAKLASAFQLLLFSLSCVAVVIMRESRIDSYDPGYRSPGYPWLQIIGIGTPLWMITKMGQTPILFSLGLIVVGMSWYFYYAHRRVVRHGAIFHIFARLGEQRSKGLDHELRGILKEKGLREDDPFDVIIARARVVDIPGQTSFQAVFERAANELAPQVPLSEKTLRIDLMNGTKVGATPVSKGVALPHLRIPGLAHPVMVMVRSAQGVRVVSEHHYPTEHLTEDIVRAFLFLVSAEDNPGQHLRILASLAGQVEADGFMDEWLAANDEEALKAIFQRHENVLSLHVERHTNSGRFIGEAIQDLGLPKGCLIAVIHRSGGIVIPQGDTTIEDGDRMTIIGEVTGLQKFLSESASGKD